MHRNTAKIFFNALKERNTSFRGLFVPRTLLPQLLLVKVEENVLHDLRHEAMCLLHCQLYRILGELRELRLLLLLLSHHQTSHPTAVGQLSFSLLQLLSQVMNCTREVVPVLLCHVGY